MAGRRMFICQLSLLALLFGFVLTGGSVVPVLAHGVEWAHADSDSDGDGVPDSTDNCDTIANPDQSVNPCDLGSWKAPLFDGSYEIDHAFPSDTAYASFNFLIPSGDGAQPVLSPDGLHVAYCTTAPSSFDPAVTISTTGIPSSSQHPVVLTSTGQCTTPVWVDDDTVAFTGYNAAWGGSIWTYTLSTASLNEVFSDGVDIGGLTYSNALGRFAFVEDRFCGPPTYAFAGDAIYQVEGNGSGFALVAGPTCTSTSTDGATDPTYVHDWGSGDSTLFYVDYTGDGGPGSIYNVYEKPDDTTAATAITSYSTGDEVTSCSCVNTLGELVPSPLNDQVAYARSESSGYHIYVASSSGNTAVVYANAMPYQGHSFAWSPDGTHLAYGSPSTATVHVVDLAFTSSDTDTGLSAPSSWGIDWSYRVVHKIPAAQTLGKCDTSISTCTTATQAEPVDTATGNYSTSTVDLSLPGIGVPFSFERSYNSADSTAGRFGEGWVDNLDWTATTDSSGDVDVRTGGGAVFHFTSTGSVGYTAPVGGRGSLSGLSGGGFEFVSHDQIHYTFDSSGRLVAVKDRNGQGLTLAYDGSGNLASVTDSVGRVIDFTTSGGHITEIDLPDGRSVSYSYSSGKLTTFTDLDGGTVDYSYDSAGRLATITDQNSHVVVSNVYDGTTGRVSEQTDGRGHHSYFAWDPATATSTYTDANGKDWKDVYFNNLLIEQIDPLDRTTKYLYDDNGNLAAVIDPRGNMTTMSYDANGNLTDKTQPYPYSYIHESWTYNSRNDVTSHTDGRGNTTSYGYNTNGNLTSVTGPDPDGSGPLTAPVTSYGRNTTTGQLTSVTDPRGKETDFGYDSDGNLTSITTPSGHVTTMGYDAGGRMTSKVDPRGNEPGATAADYTWTYTYDDANHRLTQTDPLSNETQWTYYPGGQLETVEDANNHTTTYGYDADNNLTSVEAPDTTTTTTYSYDVNNNRHTKADANGHTTTYTYDDANELIGKELPGGQLWTYQYDNNGNLVTLTDANGNATPSDPTDGVTTYGYDQLNRLVYILYSDGVTHNVSYSYDEDNNRTQMTDGAGTVNYSYDNLNRLTNVSRGSNTFSYGYDANSNLTSETYPDSTGVTYTYTDDEQLDTVTSNSQTTSYSYDPAGNLTTTTYPSGNSYTQTRTYDEAGRLTDVNNHNSTSVLSEFAYTLDPVGNPTETDRSGTTTTTTTYSYDQLDRLTSECLQTSCTGSSDPKTSWTYDNVGNRLTQTNPTAGTITYTYNSDDELTNDGTNTYTYDANGNETSAGSTTYSYDQANRLSSATISSTTANYSYDGDGNRLSATTGGSTTNFFWDPSSGDPQLDTETDGSGATLRDYLYGTDLISMTTRGASPATYYYSTDALGSVTNVTDSAGATAITYTYDAWGNTTATTATGAPSNPLQYTESYTEPISLVHLGRRDYDPATGRFLQTDPASRAAGSTYAYVDDKPLVDVDPTGLAGLSLCAGAETGFGVFVGIKGCAHLTFRLHNPLRRFPISDPQISTSHATTFGIGLKIEPANFTVGVGVAPNANQAGDFGGSSYGGGGVAIEDLVGGDISYQRGTGACGNLISEYGINLDAGIAFQAGPYFEHSESTVDRRTGKDSCVGQPRK